MLARSPDAAQTLTPSDDKGRIVEGHDGDEGFAPKLDRWLTVTEGRGPDAVKQIYLDTLNGRVPPQQGHILSL